MGTTISEGLTLRRPRRASRPHLVAMLVCIALAPFDLQIDWRNRTAQDDLLPIPTKGSPTLPIVAHLVRARPWSH